MIISGSVAFIITTLSRKVTCEVSLKIPQEPSHLIGFTNSSAISSPALEFPIWDRNEPICALKRHVQFTRNACGVAARARQIDEAKLTGVAALKCSAIPLDLIQLFACPRLVFNADPKVSEIHEDVEKPEDTRCKQRNLRNDGVPIW